MNSPRISITPYRAHKRPSFCVTFSHPKKKLRLNKSLATRDETEAKAISVDLEFICNRPEFWQLNSPRLRSLHPKAVEIFFGEVPNWVLDYKLEPNEILVEKGGRSWAFESRKSEFIRRERKEFADLQKENAKNRHEVQLLREENSRLRRAAGKHVKETLGDAVEAWKIFYRNGHAKKTVGDAFASVDSFVEAVGASRPLPMVRAGDIDRWVEGYRSRKDDDKEKKREVSPVTRRRVRAYVSSFFSWANRRYDLPENPVKKLAPIPGVERNPEHIQTIRNPDDLLTLIKALEPWPYWQAWLAMSCLAGPRWAELAWMKADAVHLENGYLRIETRVSGRKHIGTKTGRERMIPVERKVLLPLLKKYLEQRTSLYPWLFPSTKPVHTRKQTEPGVWSSNRAFLDELRPVLEKARESVEGNGEFWKFGPREWRHVFGTALGHSGFSPLEISRWMGNSPDIAERHYIGIKTMDIGKPWPFEWPT